MVAILVFCTVGRKSDEYPALDFNLYFGDNAAGYYQSSRSADGAYRFVFEYNDRGRGPHVEETIRLNEQGIIESLQITGHNYLKDTVNESFRLTAKEAAWKSTAEEGKITPKEEVFFVGINSAFGNTELLVRKMLASPDRSINVFIQVGKRK